MANQKYNNTNIIWVFDFRKMNFDTSQTFDLLSRLEFAGFELVLVHWQSKIHEFSEKIIFHEILNFQRHMQLLKVLPISLYIFTTKNLQKS